LGEGEAFRRTRSLRRVEMNRGRKEIFSGGRIFQNGATNSALAFALVPITNKLPQASNPKSGGRGVPLTPGASNEL